MKSTNEKQQPHEAKGAPKGSANPTIAVNAQSVTGIDPMAQDCSREMDTCDQAGGYELFDEGDFITMSDSLSEMDIILENVYVI